MSEARAIYQSGRKKRRRTGHHEDDEQAALFDWAAHYPVLEWLHAIPNGGNRDPREAARLKRQGVKKGVSDIFLPLPRDGYHGLYIEMKRRRRDGYAALRPGQQQFLDDMQKQGYKTAVCYGADEAIETLKAYCDI